MLGPKENEVLKIINTSSVFCKYSCDPVHFLCTVFRCKDSYLSHKLKYPSVKRAAGIDLNRHSKVAVINFAGRDRLAIVINDDPHHVIFAQQLHKHGLFTSKHIHHFVGVGGYIKILRRRKARIQNLCASQTIHPEVCDALVLWENPIR